MYQNFWAELFWCQVWIQLGSFFEQKNTGFVFFSPHTIYHCISLAEDVSRYLDTISHFHLNLQTPIL